MILAASVIVRNELQRYLQPCIGALREFCDLVCVVDDGSTDGTYEWLADQYDDQLRPHFIPEGAGFFAGHEGRRRQALLDWTLSFKPTHILAIDADEFVADGQAVRAFCERGTKPVGTLVMQEVWEIEENRLQIRQDGGWRSHPVPILYAVPEGPLTMMDRALACGREPLEIRRHAGRARATRTEVLHFGWANPETRQERYDRYAVADGGRFHQSRHLDSILWADARVQLAAREWPAGLKERLDP